LPLRSAGGAGAGHEADTQEARGGVQSEGGAGRDQRRPDGGRAGERVWGSPEPDLRLEEAASVFEGGGAGSEDTASAAQVDLLYRQIGQLKVENDLYEGFGVKPDIFPGSVTARFFVPV
jgi:hypothetical protein